MKGAFFMSMIRVSSLNFTWPSNAEPVFENAGFQIDSSWKLGLIGRNGAGKSTLFYLLCHPETFPGTLQSREIFEVFPYEIPQAARTGWDLFHEITPYEEDWQLAAELSLMNADPDLPDRDLDTLSPGERMKIMLACLFVQPDRFLLLDEPFSFLDGSTCLHMKEYLKKKHSFILVSHDRDLLEECTDHILSLEKRGIVLVKGSYSAWQRERTLFLEGQEKANQKLKSEISRLETAKAKNKNWAGQSEKGKKRSEPNEKLDRGFVSHKAAKLMQKSKNLERRIDRSIAERKKLLHESDQAQALTMPVLRTPAKRLFQAEIEQAWYGTKSIYLHPVRLEIEQGECIALCGPNGCGKSTLLHLIEDQWQSQNKYSMSCKDELRKDELRMEGTIHLASGLIISCVSQEMNDLHGSFDQYIGQSGIDKSLFFTLLRKMGFERDVFDHSLDGLSQGQKKKVALARSICTPAHLYIWDEPLNYLDIFSRLQIEQMIKTSRPTLLYVEHDQVFIQNTATHTVLIGTDQRKSAKQPDQGPE